MKRLYIGIVLLAVLLVLGTCLTAAFSTLHDPLSARLSQAAEAAAAGDLPQAVALATEARGDWERWRRFTASVSDHEPLEQIDGLFARLAVLAQMEQPAEFAATCAEISRLTAAMADSQRLTWWDFL